MVVDDEEFCIAAMQTMFDSFGINTTHHIDFCINGKEALSTIITSMHLGIEYALILMDFSMPVMDGMIATQKIRKILKEDFNVNLYN